jgi:hypothetical protein
MVTKNRQNIGGAADGFLALGRINMEEKGEGSCTDLVSPHPSPLNSDPQPSTLNPKPLPLSPECVTLNPEP